MKQAYLVSVGCLAFFFMVGTGAGTGVCAEGRKLPVMPEKNVARVNGELLTRQEYNEALAALQEGVAKGKKASAADKSALLRRLINSMLIVQEGKRMGLNEIPEIKNMVDAYAKTTLREQLMAKQGNSIKEPDKKDVEKRYRESIREWKLSSLLFEKEEDAKKMVEALQGGGNFGELSRQLVAAGTAKGGDKGQYLKAKDVSPEIAGIVATMKTGSISPVISSKAGFVVVKLEDVRFRDNAKERERARREALTQKRLASLNRYHEALLKKYVKVHKKVLDGIDYEAKEPGFQQLLKDKRVIAEIQGEQPVTVGDLGEQLRLKLYHGVDQATESKKLNARKGPTLDEILYKRVFRKEALRQGLDKTERYQYKVRAYEDSLIFGAFVQKALMPDITLNDGELKQYYEEHIGEYTSPEMMRIVSLVFAKRGDAEEAIEKLRKGTDFQWLLANAEGQAAKNSKELLEFDGKLVVTSEFPKGVRKATAGAKSGDLLLYADQEGGYFYVLSIQTAIPAKPKPYEEAKEEIAKKIFDAKIKKAMDDWADKLRAVADIKLYIKDGNEGPVRK